MFAAAFKGEELTLDPDAVEHGREVAKVVISRELRDGDTFCDEVTIRTAATPDRAARGIHRPPRLIRVFDQGV
jgi:hypothetical protein